MTDQEALKKAIEIAITNGWKPKLDTGNESDKQRYALAGKLKVNDFIYNHEFAKALWGENRVEEPMYRLTPIAIPGWRYHLQQMVIADNPIQYLADNI